MSEAKYLNIITKRIIEILHKKLKGISYPSLRLLYEAVTKYFISGCGFPENADRSGWKSVAIKNGCVGISITRGSPSKSKPVIIIFPSSNSFL